VTLVLAALLEVSVSCTYPNITDLGGKLHDVIYSPVIQWYACNWHGHACH
jgi:hypothetical protein